MSGLSVALAFSSVAAQTNQARPRVFFDCDGPQCNSQYYRTEINWVSWVNDREVADLHIIMGSLGIGSGAREYQLDFIGVDPEEAYEDQVVYQRVGTDTDRETFDGLTHALGLGIAQWATAHGYRGLVRLVGADPELGSLATSRVVSREEVDDPWNLWIFRISGNARRESEATTTETRVNVGFNASRVSPTWKLNFNFFTSHDRERRELSSDTLNIIETDWTFNPLIAYSLSTHWSVGITFRTGRDYEFNRNFQFQAMPAIEYSFFPYEEATRRSLTAFYAIGPIYQDYFEETVFGRTDEVRFEHLLEVSFSSRQTWGDAGFRLRASHYVRDFGLYNRSVRGDVEYRVTRGISVFARGDVAWVKDQIYLSAEGATDEEALLDLRRRATDRESSITVGLRLQFGSIFNNVVNNRFRGRAGGGGHARPSIVSD